MPNEMSTPLNDDELDDLWDFLDSLSDAMSMEKLDGFLAALACSQEVVMPSTYFPSIWGAGHVWDSEDDAKKYATYILRHWNHLLTVLRESDFYDILLNDPASDSAGNEWCLGFTHGINLTGEAWDFYMDNENEAGVFVPIFALAHENDPDPETRTPLIDKEQREKLLGAVCVFVPKIFQYMSENYPYDLLEDYEDDDYYYDAPSTFRREGPKIGRNDPCPCGSGKKYKKCCGRH